MRKQIILAAMGSAILFAACTSKKATTRSTEATAGEVKKNYTEADLADGKAIWQGHCNKCHKLFEPTDFNVNKWNKVLPTMTKKAHLTDDEAGKVTAYLVSNAKQG
ncbi:MAG: hypothetical protein BGO70_18570 [Bacteroidetes bacterium 43-93]|jgi:hypothetical protein|nr:hypothetical protein [Bacteroidota bacterium]OJX01734.1 MAG: hypothetical protein BGO70_18570 [Bacteroidetes bacterium 43-93]